MYIKEAFKKFTEERHAEDKGRNHDMLQEIYASTEFFDISLFEDIVTKDSQRLTKNGDLYMGTFEIGEITLPFANNFLKANEDIFVFLREYSPEIITGTVYYANFKQYLSEPLPMEIQGTLNIPITIRVQEKLILSAVNIPQLKKDKDKFMQSAILLSMSCCVALSNLSKKQVAVDTDTSGHSEYYRRKRKPTIKIPQRPIYYVLGDKKEDVTKKYNSIHSMGRLEYSHAFKVRGHWRSIGEKSLGKDRNGEYGVHGYTWVVEHVRGEGELTKRLRVLK